MHVRTMHTASVSQRIFSDAQNIATQLRGRISLTTMHILVNKRYRRNGAHRFSSARGALPALMARDSQPP